MTEERSSLWIAHIALSSTYTKVQIDFACGRGHEKDRLDLLKENTYAYRARQASKCDRSFSLEENSVLKIEGIKTQ